MKIMRSRKDHTGDGSLSIIMPVSAKMFVAVDGSDIIGYYAVIPQHFICNNETLQGAIVVDVMTHPDFRFQGMFTAIGRFALQSCTDTTDLEFTTGYPIRPEVMPGHLKIGWNIRFKIGIWVQPLSLQGILSSRIPSTGKTPRTFENNFLSPGFVVSALRKPEITAQQNIYGGEDFKG